MEETDLKSKVVRASRWSALGEMAARLITPAVFLLLARLLTPRDFGVAAAALMVITLAQLLWDAGLNKALIQRVDDLESAAHVVFWSNLALATGAYALAFTLAPWIATLFHDPRVAGVIRVQGLQILLMAGSAVQKGLLQRDLHFRTLFWVRLCTAAAPGLASIPLAWAGWGYWALVAGALTGSAAEVVTLWRICRWRPRWTYDRTLARGLAGFGVWVMAEGLLNWIVAWSDSIVLASWLGPDDLGRYRAAATLVTTWFGLALSPLLPVLFSAFSRMQADRALLLSTYLKTTQFIALVALPSAAAFFFLREEAATLVFGQRWSGVGIVLGVLGVMQGVSWLVGANPEAYRAIGRPDISVKVTVVNLLYYVPAYLISIRYGLETFLAARLGVALVALPVHLGVSFAVLGLRPSDLFRRLRWVVVGTAALALAWWALQSILPVRWPWGLRLPIQLLVGAVAFAPFLWLEREFVRSTVGAALKRRR